MPNPSHHDPHELVLLVAFVLAAALTNDATAKERKAFMAFEGPPRPDSAVSLLRLEKADWLEIGGVKIKQADYRDIHALPGRHAVKWGGTIPGRLLPQDVSYTDTVLLEPGHTYTVHVDYKHPFGQDYQSFLWISDVTKGRVVAGRSMDSETLSDGQLRARSTSQDQAVFFSAAQSGDLDDVKRFLDAGIDVNVRDQRKRTALMFAADGNHVAVVDLLLRNGADPCATLEPPFGSTALMCAAAAKCEDAVRRLLDHPENCLQVRGSEGQTALMHAASVQADGIVRLLIERGAEVNAVDAHGKSVLDWAARNSTRKILREAGAKKGKDLDGS